MRKAWNRVEYHKGDTIGAYGVIYLEEAPTKKGQRRRALFECPTCHDPFEAPITVIKTNKQKGCKKCGRERTAAARRKELSGQRFGRLIPLYPLKERKRGNVVWHCQCDCGNEHDVIAADLISGHIKSCGCYNLDKIRERNTIDITGQRFGKLIAIKSTNKIDPKSKMFLWEFKCDCGTTKTLPVGWVTCGNTTSCGCTKSRGETAVANALKNASITFYQQHSFSQCTNKEKTRKLYFDFYLPDYSCCIEYDGEQHFFANHRTWNTEENLTKTQERDEIKDLYCTQNNILLIRISYLNYNKINSDYIISLINKAIEERGIVYG